MKTLLIATASIFIGITFGFFLAIKIFAVKVDLLSVPYSNTPVSLLEELKITQGDIVLILPKGSEVIYKYDPKGVPVYSLEFVGDLGPRPKTQASGNEPYFFINNPQ